MTFIKANAKAIAGFLTPIVVLVLTWAAKQAGADFIADEPAVEAAIVAVLTYVSVWFTPKNVPAPPE